MLGLTIPTLLSLAFTVLVLCYVVYQRYLHPLASIPGPFAASISRLWITRLSWVGGTHKVMVDLHRQHGKYVRIGPNEVYEFERSYRDILQPMHGADQIL